jgi:hypothetical protein
MANLTTVQVTKLPLYHKILKLGMICVAKPGITDELYIVYTEEFPVSNTLYVRYVHLTKGQTYS